MVFNLQPLVRTGIYRLPNKNGVRNVSVHSTDYDQIAPLYPRGLSPHGIRYLWFPPNDLGQAIEREIERCRLQNHPEEPSRYESYFSWPTEEAARAWMDEQREKGYACTLLLVESESAIRRQQALVNHYPNFRARGVEACHLYWQETDMDGRIELQMPGAITVNEVIEQDS